MAGVAIVTERDLGWGKLARALRMFHRDADTTLELGWFVDTVATYASANEYGTDTIPSRPFFSTALDQNRDKWAATLERQVGRVLDGAITPEQALIVLANVMRTDIIRTIQTWSEPPNDPETVRNKRSSSPLVDTGQMQRTITWRITDGRGGEVG